MLKRSADAVSVQPSHLFCPERLAGKYHCNRLLYTTEKPRVQAAYRLGRVFGKWQPPVYVGFGSIKDKATFRTTVELVAQAVERLGERSVIGMGWSSADVAEVHLPKSVMLIGNVPHSWLFPCMAVVVHHGGAGTAAAGLIAGKPTLIVPHTTDQPAWGLHMWELGVGAKPIPKKQLTRERLESGLREELQPNIVLEFNVANVVALGE
jgi:UDP:flavonoid glycosyltransferase YjiC (YdhE family)